LIRATLCLLALAVLPALAGPRRSVTIRVVAERYRPLAFDQQKLGGMLAERLRANSEGYLERANDKQEQAGRFLDASANAYEYSHDPKLKAVMDRAAKPVLANAAGDASLISSDLNILKYNLLGLLAYHRVTADENALNASKKLGDIAVTSVREQSASHAGASASLIAPLVLLYRRTADTRYLETSKSLANLALESKGLNIDPSDENLSALEGLVELYRATSDNSYLRAAVAAWNALRVNRLTLTGTLDSSTNDSCITAAWMGLTMTLFRITGEAQYGEQLERTIYNQLFAAQDAKSGNTYSAVPLNGAKKAANGMESCSFREAYGISLIPSAVWGRYGNGIAIALYSSGRATFKLRRRTTVQLYSEANYPETGNILLHIDPSHEAQFSLRLRVPEWALKFTVDVGGSHLAGKPGDFLTITRSWKRGDTVQIAMDLAIRVLSGGAASPNEIAVQRGPQVLALDKAQNPHIKDFAAAGPASVDAAHLKPRSVETKFASAWTEDQAYAVAGEYAGKPQELILVPFADARTYRVWMKKPGGSDH
jgi:uncharacterized protein